MEEKCISKIRFDIFPCSNCQNFSKDVCATCLKEGIYTNFEPVEDM
jgi:hypothetical protein